MSGIGNDPDDRTPGNQPDGSFYKPFSNSPQPGLLGGEFASQQANASADGGMNWATGPATDVSGDGIGLPPSVTIVPNLPQRAVPSAAGGGSNMPASFNPYDWVHDVLNTPAGSKGLEVTQDLARSFEDAGKKAALVGLGGAVLFPPFAPESLALAGVGAAFGGFGKAGDAVTSFLKSIQQDNGKPLNDFGIGAATPDVTDLVPDGD